MSARLMDAQLNGEPTCIDAGAGLNNAIPAIEQLPRPADAASHTAQIRIRALKL